MTSNYTQERLEFKTVTIAIGETVSTALDLIGKIPVAIITPSAITGSSFGVQVSSDNDTYYNYYNTSGTLVTIAVGASRWIGIVPADFANARHIKLVSNSAEGAERTITIVMRGM